MIPLLACAVVFAVAFLLANRSLIHGLCAVLTVGYFYGIVRANYPSPVSHFIFDFACVGFFLGQLTARRSRDSRFASRRVTNWLILFIGWAVIVSLMPFQDYLVQLVGLRGNIFLVLFLLFGARLTRHDWLGLGVWVAFLNLVALVFGVIEYRLGVPLFYPYGPSTELIYRSWTVEGVGNLRIPAIFTSAHAYGGTMVLTLPLLINIFVSTKGRKFFRFLSIGGIVAVILGVLMCAARMPFVVMVILSGVTFLSLRRNLPIAAVLIASVCLALYFTGGEERLQRFSTLSDTEAVTQRVSSSVNSEVFAAVMDYPLGNGIGSGGTSMPYFLQDRLIDPIVFENEYARIQLELGLPGLLIWVAFLVSTMFRAGYTDPRDQLFARLARAVVVASALSGLIGIGMLTSIPSTVLLFCYAGWLNRLEPKHVTAAQGRTVFTPLISQVSSVASA
jgi:hypothetical protein